MAKIKSNEIDRRLEAISLLKAASKQWPEGMRHELVRLKLERATAELQEELLELLQKTRGVKAPDRAKAQADAKQ